MGEKWPGIGDRLRDRLLALDYRQPDGTPDVMRFSMERRYVHTYVYKWLSGITPSRANLYRLAADLGTTPMWLLFGDEALVTPKRPRKPAPIAGGSAEAGPKPASDRADPLRLIGLRVRRFTRWPVPVQPAPFLCSARAA